MNVGYNFLTSFDSFVATKREGSIITTSDADYVDLTGGQHALLYSRLAPSFFSEFGLQLEDLVGVNRYAVSRNAQRLADWIAEYDEEPELRSYFVSGGTEAFEIATAIVQFVAKSLDMDNSNGVIAGLSESYHGYSLAALNAGSHAGHAFRTSGRFDLKWPTLDFSSLKDPKQVEVELLRFFDLYNVLALVVEPIGGTTSGAREFPTGVLSSIVKVCRQQNVFIIADEVITGFGRTGSPFCLRADSFDIRISGKLLGAGIVPICAVSLSPTFQKRASNLMRELPLRLTYAGNALATKYALWLQEGRASVDTDLIERSKYLEQGLLGITDDEYVSLNGRGFLRAVSIKSEQDSICPKLMAKNAFKKGILIMTGRNETSGHTHFMVTPSLDASYADLDKMVEAAEKVLKMQELSG